MSFGYSYFVVRQVPARTGPRSGSGPNGSRAKLGHRIAGLAVCGVLVASAGAADAAGIEGVLYDSGTLGRVSGVSLRLLYDDSDPLSPGTEVPAGLLGAGQQNQIPGSDGSYRFDVQPGRRYRIAVAVERTPLVFPSRRSPPQPGLATAGPVSDSDAPPTGARPRRYFLRFDVAAAGDEITNNHLPVDRLSSRIELTKVASRARAEVGDVVTYRVVIANLSGRDLEAEGRQLFVRDAPPRGFDLIAGSAGARIDAGGQRTALPVGVSRAGSSSRVLRFGPIDLPRAGRVVLEYRMAVGADTRPGKSRNLAVLVDAGGVELSGRAAAAVEVSRPRGLESSVILGRVFCDRDGDRRFDRGEAGVFGARVYLDTGSYAITDSGGLYHFTRVDAGARLLKIDTATLAGSKLRGDPRRLLRITEGLGARANFPVSCRRVEISGTDPRVRRHHRTRPTAAPISRDLDTVQRRLEITGELVLLGVEIDGERLELPTATTLLAAPRSLRLRSSGGVNLAPVPAGGYGRERPLFELGWKPPAGVAARRWVFEIDEVAPDKTARRFLRLTGSGAPPASVAWDGRGDSGKPARPDRLYVAQLLVVGSRAKIEAASIRVPFGVGYGTAAGPIAETWTGALFAGAPTRPTATAKLEELLDRLAPQIAAGDRVEIRVHGDGSGSSIAAIAESQRRAELVRSLLEARGVAAAAVDARGRGNAEPVGSAAQNLRVEVAVKRAAGAGKGAEVPERLPAEASALIDGVPAEVDSRGKFRWDGAVPTRGSLLIDVRAQDGRRAAIEVKLGGDSKPVPNRSRRLVRIAGDVSSRVIDVVGRRLPPALLDLEAQLVDGDRPIDRVTSTGGRLGPLSFAFEVPAELDVVRWKLEVSDDRDRPVASIAHSERAVPRRFSWDGTARGKAQLLASGRSYSYRLAVVLADGSRAWSPRRRFAVDPAADWSPAPPRSFDQLVVNGVAWPVMRGTFNDTVDLPRGAALLVDVTLASGQRAVYVVVLDRRPTEPFDRDREPEEPVAPRFDRPTVVLPLDPHGDDPIPPTFGRRPAAGPPVTRAQLDGSAAADFTVELPPPNTTLGIGEVGIRGRARPGNRISVNGVAVAVSSRGRFAAVVPLAVDTTALVITSVDAEGFVSELRWPVTVERRQLFTLALGELAVSTSITRRGLFADTAYLPTMTPDSTATLGPLLIHGRASLYLKGELDAGDFFGRVKITAHVDTARRKADRGFFENTHDPVTDPPALGDSAVEVRDANGRGKVYASIEARGSKAVIGALAVELGGARLFRYGRTVDGGAAQLREKLGDHRVEVDAFGTAASTETRRDHLWFRSTGGTVYYLRYTRVVEGSELLRAVVLDRDSGQPIRERLLARNVDYTVDYQRGRIWMIEPLPHAEPSSWILDNSEAAITPADGNPVYLDVRYEHRDTAAAPDDHAGGVEARYRYRKAVTAGVGFAGETREGAADYRLWGAHARFVHRERSSLSLEIAGSRRREGDLELSTDGGLTFRDLDAGLDPATAADHQLAWRIGADVHVGDFLESGAFSKSRFRFYVQDIDDGFSTTSTALERGRLKLGALASTALGSRDAVVVRHQAEIADVPRLGPTSDDAVGGLGPVDERASYLTSLQWSGRRGRLVHQAELAHQRLSSTAALADGTPALDAERYGVGGRLTYALVPRLSGRISQQAWVASGDIDPLLRPLEGGIHDGDRLAGIATGAGITWQALEDAALVADVEQRWNGDRAASVGLRARLSELGSFYVAERARTGVSGPAAVTVIGAEDRGPDGEGRSYGEYQIESTALGVRNRAILGLGRRWRVHRSAAVGFAYEHQMTTGGFLPDGTPVGENQRDVVRGGLDLGLGGEVIAGLVAEVRRDRGLRGSNIEGELVESDPRVLGSGFADHGGVAPGSPLILPAGTATQLVGSAGLTWRAEEGVSLFGRARGAVTFRDDQVEPSVDRPGFGELTGGLAFRSLLDDTLNLLMRYSYVRERRPGEEDAESRSHILAALPLAELPARLRLSGKLAWKRSAELGGLAADAEVDAVLALARLGYRLIGGWDAAVEGRSLWVRRDGSRELLAGTLAEVGYWFNPFVRFGLGYNFSRFDDNEFGDLTRDAHGLFIRVTGHM